MRKADINKPNHTMYLKARRTVAESKTVLKQSKNNKIADKGRLPVVKKGKFKGYVIHTLTLEERATCPRDCFHWDDCYGNNMAFAHRIEHGQALEDKLSEELDELCATYKGVIVRLHVLGDFYSVAYVKHWATLLGKHDNLAVWGYTGHKHTSPIGNELQFTNALFRHRFNVRFSDGLDVKFSAISADKKQPVKGEAFICPEQTGATPNCANCALCWEQPEQQVLFITH